MSEWNALDLLYLFILFHHKSDKKVEHDFIICMDHGNVC